MNYWGEGKEKKCRVGGEKEKRRYGGREVKECRDS